jgi:hypothetical protein
VKFASVRVQITSPSAFGSAAAFAPFDFAAVVAAVGAKLAPMAKNVERVGIAYVVGAVLQVDWRYGVVGHVRFEGALHPA